MKNLASFFLAAALILFAACAKNSNPGSNASNNTADSISILGKWQLIRDVNYFYAPSTGLFLDSAYQKLSAQDYLNFANGDIYIYQDDASTAGPVYDTIPYQLYENKYLILALVDTANFRISSNDDTLLLTKIQYSTAQTEYDTILGVK